MRSPLSSYRTLRDRLKTKWNTRYGEPSTPYTSRDETFRAELKEDGNQTLFDSISLRLEKRFGFRKGSLANTLLLLSVVLTGALVFHDTVADTLVSVDKWARPLFLPALWYVVEALHFLIQASKAAEDEVNPDPDYRGDEAQQHFKAAHGDVSVKEAVSSENMPAGASFADLTEAASRTAHDRGSLWLKRVYKNKSLDAASRALKCFGAALAVYAIIGLFV